MAKLHVLQNTELSEYCLNILEKHDIRLAREFVVENSEKLMKMLNLNFEQVKKIKIELTRLYGPTVSTVGDKIKADKLKIIVYGTQISALDQILGERATLHSQSFWEVCGPTGVGKTQLALSLMINFIINQKLDVLYIDTKLDFSGGRIKKILKARKIEPEMLVGIMSSIKVERVLSAQGVVEMLECLYTQLQLGNLDVITIKLIIVDSLPAVWFPLNAAANRLLSRLSQIIHRLLQDYYIAVICVNLSLVPSDNQTNPNSLINNYDTDVTDLIEADDMDIESKNTSLKPLLGFCWLNKPHVRLSMEYPATQDDKDSSLRVINVIKSSRSPKNVSCLVKIQDVGVVGLDFKLAEEEDLTL